MYIAIGGAALERLRNVHLSEFALGSLSCHACNQCCERHWDQNLVVARN